MTNKILVTYATCTGSTVGVAEAIGKALVITHNYWKKKSSAKRW